MQRIVLIGAGGQVGWELQRCLPQLGSLMALDYPQLDLEDFGALRRLLQQVRPTAIVNAAAYTNVDGAEGEAEKAERINAIAPGVLAEVAREADAALIHYSTDYIFDGEMGRPYVEDDAPRPLGVYGQTKLDGERAIEAIGGNYLILRTSCVYSLRKDGFVTRILERARAGEPLRVVNDQIGNPTWCRPLANATLQLLRTILDAKITPQRRTFHLAGDGYASRFEWARALLRHDPQTGEDSARSIATARTDEFPAAAKRPLFSALDCSAIREAYGVQLPPWEQALKDALQES